MPRDDSYAVALGYNHTCSNLDEHSDAKEQYMSENDLAQIAYLLRRAGFGARRDELETYAAKGYDAVVDELLHPERFPEVEDDVFDRY